MDFVRHSTRDGSGIIRAGINGGFFDDNLILVGHVGRGQSWFGNDIHKHRWRFGMQLQGSSFIIERMIATVTGTYTILPGVRNYPYGLTGIGCLIRGGNPELLANQADWPNANVRDTRTLVAWDRRNFFLIVCERSGWTWEHTKNFLMTELPNYMQNHWRVSVSIQGAMMLDGGGSTQFFYRCAPSIGRGGEVGYSAEKDSPRRVPTIVHAWATGLIRCQFPGHQHR